MHSRSPLLLLLALILGWFAWPATSSGADGGEYLAFVRAQAAALRAGDEPPTTAEAWRERREKLRANLRRSWGDVPATPCPLDARVLGDLKRDGYRVERVTFQTLPGIWMLANAYVPDRAGRLPAVLCVHGHWAGAKQDRVVQSRCIGLAKLGFFVLAVDAFGAGERAIGKALGEYHGAMSGAMLLPIGQPLSGIQVYENQRCVDYLATRPEVDAARIGVTGASGGGNQSMYAGAFDERLAAAVPVCSVGNYHAYLGAACCMCEVVPDALRYTDEGDLLGLAAPRGLMVVSATRDAPQFSVAEAKKSLARATDIFTRLEARQQVRHTIIESGHDYNQTMREAMYGWMTKLLKGEGDGQPIAEPTIQTEEPETLRCYPGQTRPDDYTTLPKFAHAQAARLTKSRPLAMTADERQAGRRQLAQSLGLDRAVAAPLESRAEEANGERRVSFVTEPGLRLTLRHTPVASAAKTAILLDMDGAEAAAGSDVARKFRAAGWSVVTFDLRATGAGAVRGDVIGDAPDHNSAEWGMWIGRPLLGQWVHDLRRAIDVLHEASDQAPPKVTVAGRGPAGLVALAAAAVDPRIEHVVGIETLSTYVSSVPYRKQRLGTMVPGIVRDVGDVRHWMALVERPVRWVAPVQGDGQPLPGSAAKSLFLDELKNVRVELELASFDPNQ